MCVHSLLHLSHYQDSRPGSLSCLTPWQCHSCPLTIPGSDFWNNQQFSSSVQFKATSKKPARMFRGHDPDQGLTEVCAASTESHVFHKFILPQYRIHLWVLSK